MKYPTKTKPKGFAAMKPSQVSAIAFLGGVTVSRDRQHMSDLGRIGGINSGKARAAARRASRKQTNSRSNHK